MLQEQYQPYPRLPGRFAIALYTQLLSFSFSSLSEFISWARTVPVLRPGNPKHIFSCACIRVPYDAVRVKGKKNKQKNSYKASGVGKYNAVSYSGAVGFKYSAGSLVLYYSIELCYIMGVCII